MKKKFKDRRIGKILTSKPFKAVADIAIGFFAPTLKVSTGAITGAVEGFKNEKQSNLESQSGGVGKLNKFRLTGYIMLALFVAYALGWIPKDVLSDGIELLNEIELFGTE